MVTSVILPAVRKLPSTDSKIDLFEKIEGKFALQARVMTMITAITGFYMLYHIDGWERYFDYRFWWLHAMTLVWFLFSMVLFVLEPFVLKRVFKEKMEQDPEKTLAIMQRAHWVLLTISLVTIFGSVAGSHGWFFIR